MISHSIEKKYIPPIDISKWRLEKDVKKAVRAMLDYFGWFAWMPGANGFGSQGVHDFLALKDGVFLTVETKFGDGKPTAMQRSFAGHVFANNGFSLLVNETKIDHLYWFLESFEVSKLRQLKGLDVEDAHGSRMLNALASLTELWG